MQGQQQALKRQAGWARDKGDQDLGSQRLTPQAAEAREAPTARVEQPHAGDDVQRLMFVTYMDIEEQRRDEGHRCALFLAHHTEALALRAAEGEDRRQLMSHVHNMRRQGLRWGWHRGCKGMLEEGVAEPLRLKPQALEKHARWELERKACSRQDIRFGQRMVLGPAPVAGGGQEPSAVGRAAVPRV